jgi:hypothetical protein
MIYLNDVTAHPKMSRKALIAMLNNFLEGSLRVDIKTNKILFTHGYYPVRYNNDKNLIDIDTVDAFIAEMEGNYASYDADILRRIEELLACGKRDKLIWKMQEVLIVRGEDEEGDAEGYLDGHPFEVDAILLPEDEWDFTFTDGRSISFEKDGIVYTNYNKTVDVIDLHSEYYYAYKDEPITETSTVFVRLEVIEGGLDCEEWEALQK